MLLHRSPRDTTQVLFSVPMSGGAEAAATGLAAREAGEAWGRTPAAGRASRLSRLADRLEAEASDLGGQLAADVGKPISLGEEEARRAAALIRNAAKLRFEDGRGDSGSRYRRVPLGVVAAVTPWNNPVAIPWGKFAPALVLGNTVVWKPSPAGTGLARRTLEMARDAGIPEGVLGLLTGDHRTAAALMSDPRIDAVSLTGSSAAGWAAQEICARRRIPLQAELGGNNAAIVWEGADLSKAAEQIALGAFAFSGQRCT